MTLPIDVLRKIIDLKIKHNRMGLVTSFVIRGPEPAMRSLEGPNGFWVENGLVFGVGQKEPPTNRAEPYGDRIRWVYDESIAEVQVTVDDAVSV